MAWKSVTAQDQEQDNSFLEQMLQTIDEAIVAEPITLQHKPTLAGLSLEGVVQRERPLMMQRSNAQRKQSEDVAELSGSSTLTYLTVSGLVFFTSVAAYFS